MGWLMVDLRVSTPWLIRVLSVLLFQGRFVPRNRWYPFRNRRRLGGIDSYPLDRGWAGFGRLALDRIRRERILTIGPPFSSYSVVSGASPALPDE